MKKKQILTWLKVSILSDLLIQYIDEFAGDNHVSDKMKKFKFELEKDLENISEITYQLDVFRTNTFIQNIQSKVDTIFRKEFKEIEIKK